MDPQPPIQILLVEDSDEDALLLAAHLKAKGLDCRLSRVQDLEPLREALDRPGWDILLTDYNLPAMNALDVLGEARRRAPHLPCIILSGQIGEEAAVESLRRGAKDFVSKSKLARLVPAIQRELEEHRLQADAQSARADLRTLEDQFRAIASAALDGIVMIDPEGRISFWNQSAERIFGYTQAEALGCDLHDLVAPTRYHPTIRSGLEAFRTTGRGPAIGKVTEMKARRKDGSEFPAEFSLAGIQHGSVWHAVGVVRDVSERKFHENEQFANLQFLRTVLETIPSPLYYEDMEGYIRGCNRAFEKFVGLSSVSVLGRKTAELLSGAVEDQVRELEPSFLVLPDALETSFHMNLADGRVCHALFRKAPFWDGDGHPQGYVATLLDITELKASEEALRRNQSLFTAIHRHVVDLVAIIDADGHRLYTSPSYQFILGYEEQEMARLSSTDLLHPEDAQRVSQALIGIMEGRPTQRLEYRLRHKDGRWLHFESTAAIIPDAEGGPMRALVVARDITERKASEMNQAAMEVQLRQAQKLEAIGQLAAGIAHEINTPTQFIGDNITFLRDAFRDTFDLVEKVASHLGTGSEAAAQLPPDPRAALAELEASDLAYLREEIPKAIRQSLEGVERISKIVKAMKDFSHPGGASLTLTDLHQAIESTITVSRNEWKYGAELVTDFAPDIPPVPCFPGEFNQVMLNLIVNAAHAIESAREGKAPDFKGQIRIKTHLAKDEVVITVSDNGTGIPEAVQSRMFEPFYTTKPVGKGSGQGLAIAHAVIVEKHRGRIEVESSVGQGTSFILHLPLNTSEQGEGIP